MRARRGPVLRGWSGGRSGGGLLCTSKNVEVEKEEELKGGGRRGKVGTETRK